MENGQVLVRCLPEALGSILGAMEERGFSVYIPYLVIDNEMYVMVKGILTQIITLGSTGEKLYARPSSLTASRKALHEAAQTAGLCPFHCANQYECTNQLTPCRISVIFIRSVTKSLFVITSTPFFFPRGGGF